MPSQTVTVINELGLHARAAAKIVNTAKRFAAKTSLTHAGNCVDATSIIGILTLGGTCGVDVEIDTSGEDEDSALEAMVALFADRFGEES